MLKLKSYASCPPDGFRYVHQETGHVTWAENVDTWHQQAVAHRKANNLPIPDNFFARMEEQLCDILPSGWCDQDDINRPRVDMRFGLRDVLAWAEAHLKLLGNNFVDQAESERRAKICASCYMNVEGQGCAGCQKVATLFTNELVQRKTQSDQFLKSCAVCKCYNRASVHFPLEILESSSNSEHQMLFPNFCWRKQTGDNYAP